MRHGSIATWDTILLFDNFSRLFQCARFDFFCARFDFSPTLGVLLGPIKNR
uniref:Uncharacterized protein n=1 Tax=Arundo donax TaxID=35708 RepID=A0A0A9GUK3_ARUDO